MWCGVRDEAKDTNACLAEKVCAGERGLERDEREREDMMEEILVRV